MKMNPFNKLIQYSKKLVMLILKKSYKDMNKGMVETILANPYLNGETIRLDGAVRMQ